MLLLGGITASPEIAAVSGASWLGNAPLSLGNLLGSLCINLVLLAIADATLSRAAITSTVPGPDTLLQGTLAIVALALTAAAGAVGDVSVFGVGVWSIVLFVFVLFAFWLSARYAGTSAWRARRLQMKMPDETARGHAHRVRAARLELARMPLGRIVARTGRFEIVAALLGAILTAIYLMGLLEREDRTVFGMGYDSLAVLVVYAGGLVLLYAVS